MPGDFPDELSNAACTVHDFNSGDIIACGHMNVRFVEQTDRLRVMRFRFAGEFKPESPDDKASLDRALRSGFSAGAAGFRIEVESGGKYWALIVKFDAGDAVYPFTGRQDPKPVY